MAQLLRGHLQEGQRIVIFTGNWGAYEFYSVLRDEVKAKHVIIGETSGNMAASPTLTYPATTMMKPSKKSMSFATIPGTAAPAVVEELKQAFPEFYPVKNVLDTSMNNTNPPVHVPFCLFNITRDGQRRGRPVLRGVPPRRFCWTSLWRRMQSRCAVTKAIGGEPKTILELMNAAWNVTMTTSRTWASIIPV